MVNLEEIKLVIKKAIEPYQMKLVNVKWLNQADPILEVSITNQEHHFDLNMAERVTEPISEALDGSGLIERAYILDIGSPGAERTLEDLADMKSQIDQYVYVKLVAPKAGHDHYEGYLRAVDEDTIVVEYREKTRILKTSIDQDNIALIRLAIKI